MISIIEDSLVEIIEAKLNYIKNNPSILSKIFRIPDDRIEYMYKSIFKNDPSVSKAYPVDTSTFPRIIVSISGESESPSTVGDYIDQDEVLMGNLKEFKNTLTVSNSQLSFLHFGLVHSISHVWWGEVDVLGDIEILDDYTVSIDVPDGEEVIVEGLLQTTIDSMLETSFETTYKVEVWTQNADVTTFLYHIMKWILLHSRKELIDLGLNQQKLSGGDFQPVPSFFPTFVYIRGISLWTKTFVAVPEMEIEVVPISGVDVVLKKY